MTENSTKITDYSDTSITLKELFKTLSRYSFLIGITIFFTMLCAGVYLYTAESRYRASGQIMVTPSRSSLLTDTINGQYEQFSDFGVRIPVNNAMTRIRGTAIADSVILKSNAFTKFDVSQEQYRFIQYFTAAPPDKPKIFSVIAAKNTNHKSDFLIMAEDGTLVGSGKYNEKFVSKHFSLTISDMRPLKSFQIRLDPVRTARQRILSDLRIVNIKDSDIIEVSFTSQNPVQAKTIANGFMSEMEYQNLLDKREKATVLKNFLENQYRNVSTVLENAENQYLNSKLSTGIVSVSEQTRQYIDLLRYLEEKRIDYEIKLAEAAAAKEKATTILNGDPDLKNFSKFSSSPFSQGNEILRELYSRVASLSVENAKLIASYSPSHPQVLQSNAELDAARKELDAAIATTVANATKGIDPLLRPMVENLLMNHINANVYQQLLSRVKSEIAGLNRTIEKLPKSEIAKARYERNVGINQQIHNLLLTRLEEARIMEASTISDVKVINWAEIPTSPVSPQKARILFLALLFSLFLATVIVFVCEHFKPSFDTVENIEKLMGAPVLGLIPHLSRRNSQKREILIDSAQEGNIKFYAYEVFNSFLVNFLASSNRIDQKTFVVSSTFAREGKSIVATNFAVAMAKAGKKVLLIDCDLRNPVLHTFFDIPNEHGLIDLVQTGSTKGFFKTNYPNLIFLPSGNVKNVIISELLHAPNLEESIRQLENRFDLILIDTPPVMLYTDAVVLSSHFKNVLLVIKAGADESAVLSVRKALLKAGARVSGIVVNKIRKSILFGHSYAQYGYGYGYGYKEKRRDEMGRAV